MIKGIEDTIVGFNVVLACEDSERFTEGKNKILECLKILNEKSCDELKNSSENYVRDFADKSIFNQHMFTRVTAEHLCTYPERYKELENLSFLLGGDLKSDKTVYDLHDIDIENFVLNLTKLFYAVSGIPVGINLAAFPDKGSVTWGAHMFSYADENKSKMTDLWSLDFSFDYNDDDDVIFEVVDREEFEEWNEKIYEEILCDLSNPEKSWFYRKIIGKKNCMQLSNLCKV